MVDVASLTAAFAYGFAGSLHCVAMCGPLTMVASSRKRATLPIIASDEPQLHSLGHGRSHTVAAYQISRLLGYTALGAIFGAVGHGLDLSLGVTVSKLLPFVLVTLLLLQAFEITSRWDRFLPRPAVRRLARFKPKNEVALAAFIGGITAFIPCGFLYSTAPMAIAGGSASAGALLLAVFALGTTPALVATGVLGAIPVAKLQPLRRVFLLAAALVIALRIGLLSPTREAEATTTPTCHGAPLAEAPQH